MSRTVNTIRMLRLLNENGKMSVDELAKELNTNYRNIREYRKELNNAGIETISTKGANGGIQLVHKYKVK